LAGCALIESLELIELLGRKKTDDVPYQPSRNRQFISLHVPTCSEPPDVVAATLRALSRLDYEPFEVLVIDNNTEDERLWRPVEELCRELGPRFRFFHLPKWPGFKGGALNFALGQTNPDATLIAVVDADYETISEFPLETQGYFEDERIAFVQTPQDYRDWQRRAFTRFCYWEYWQVFAVSMKLRNQGNAILLHGTMSLIRKSALISVGGWAEWCLTEDSELGLRLLSDGFRGVYVVKTYGRGLVPFTYRDYKRQRRRWVIGGVQQLKRHAASFLLWRRKPGGITVLQQIHYLRGWLLWFRDGIIVSSAPLAFVAAAACLVGLYDFSGFVPLAIGLMCVLGQLLLRQIVVYGMYLSVGWRDALGAMIANLSLTWTVGCAWLAGSTSADQVFQRTPKRPHHEPTWIDVARGEIAAGLLALVLGLAIAVRFGRSAWAATSVLCIYAALFLPAAWMAWRAFRDAMPLEKEVEGKGNAGVSRS
jgi:cellulose synthase/poly-beta-1,6-N-acetylglucosamine synthase-like glycosyltransferase